MTAEDIVAKYQKKVEEIHRGTDNRVTHAFVEGAARSEMVSDIQNAILRERLKYELLADAALAFAQVWENSQTIQGSETGRALVQAAKGFRYQS